MTAKNEQKSNDSEKLPGSVYIVVLALIIDLLGFTVILPLIPSILDYYESNSEDSLYNWLKSKVEVFQIAIGVPDVFNNVLFGGLLGSMFSMLQFLAAPIIGALSDVYGRKPVLLISMFGIGVSHIVWAFSNNFIIFVFARIIGGIFRGNVSLSTAIVTDLCSSKTRSKGMALVGIAFAVGFIIGPVIGAVFASKAHILGSNFYIFPAIFAVTTSVVDVLLLYKYFDESLPLQNRAKSVMGGMSKAYTFISPFSLFSFKAVQNINKKDLAILQELGKIYFIFLFLYSGLEYSLSFLTHIRFSFTSMQQGQMYFFSGIIMIIVQGGYIRRIPPGKEIRTALIGSALIIPSFIIIGLSRNIATLYCGLALYAYASATVVPCLTIIVSKLGSKDQKGTVLGIFRSLGSLARGLGPFVSAVAYWSMGSTYSYCFGGILLIVPMLLIRNIKTSVERRFAEIKTS